VNTFYLTYQNICFLFLLKTIQLFKVAIVIFISCCIPVKTFSQETHDTQKSFDSSKLSSQFHTGIKLIQTSPDLPGVKSMFLESKKQVLDTLKNSLIKKRLSILSERKEAYTQTLKDIQKDFKKAMASPVSFNKASLSMLGKSGNFSADSFQTKNYNLLDAEINGSVLGIPFQSVYQNHYYPFITNENQNRLSFQYDKDAYFENIKNKLKGKFNPEDFLPGYKDPVGMLKATAEKALRNELTSLNDKYKGLLEDKLKQVGNLSDLFSKDLGSLKQQLLNPEWLSEYQSKVEMLNQLQDRINSGGQVNMQDFTNLKNQLLKYKGVSELVNVLEANNKKWQQSGLLKKIKESGLLQKEMLQKVINDPGIIRTMAKQKLDLNGIQRLFLSVTKLNAGQSTTDFSKMLTGNSILNGLNTGFLLNNKKSVDLMAGIQKTFNSVLDIPFTNNFFSPANKLIGLKLNNTQQSGNTNSLSLLTIQSSENGRLPFMNYTLPRKSMIIGISRQIEFNKTNHVEVELSKSANYFINELNSDSSVANHGFGNSFNSGNLLKSIAASINHIAEYEAINFQTETFIRYSGINYDNPVTSFVPAGTIEVGASIRKTFLEKKLQVYARTNLRRYKFSEFSDNKWKSSNHFIDIKWKMHKGQYVSLRYQPARSVRIADGIKSINAISERLAATLAISARLNSFQYRNYFTLAYLRNEYGYSYGQLASNKSLQVTSLQNIVFGRQVFYSNTTFTNVNNPSAFIFFNTSFNSDLGITYNLGKNLSASTSVNYNSIKGWYQQIACKQSLSGQIGEKIKMDIYVDLGKNLKQLQPLPFSPYRAEWSIQYLFNN
jgi:hypothetical protein